MPGSNGSMNSGAARTTAGFMNNPAFERSRYYQARVRSGVFGALSKKMGQTFGENSGTERSENLTKSAAFLRVEKKQGDTHNWTMEKVLKGPPTFGDRVPETAGTLGFLHAEVVLHKTRSPAFQVPADMEQIRMHGSVDVDFPQAIRDQTSKWHGEAIAHESIITALKGASDNLLSSAANGGRAVDLGRGAGIAVSPLNAIVLGTGKIGGATLAARETALYNAITALSTGTAGHLISTAAIQEIGEELSTANTGMVGVDIGGKEMYYMVLPSICRLQLIGQTAIAALGAQYVSAWGTKSPLLQMEPLVIGNIIVFFDNYLSKYSPDVTGTTPAIVWGKDTTDFQSWGYADLSSAQKARGVGLVFGARAILEATNGSIEYTEAEGKHKTSMELSSMIKRSMVRASWVDKQDTSALPLDYGTMAFCFAHKGIKHGA
jgi:hypothetical protein